jgi:hypothetical protein
MSQTEQSKLAASRNSLASKNTHRHDDAMSLPPSKRSPDRAARIYWQLAGARGLDDAERWQYALFFAITPQQRCHFSLKTAHSALARRLEKRRGRAGQPVERRKPNRSKNQRP